MDEEEVTCQKHGFPILQFQLIREEAIVRPLCQHCTPHQSLSPIYSIAE
jgi:hypothetical protein